MKKFEKEAMPFIEQRKSVSVETISHSFNIFRIYLTDDGVQGTGAHVDQLEAILSASENDVIEVYCLGCGGGSADSILMLLNALVETPAHTVTILEGHNASAASMPMMVTTEVRVGNYASVMFHSVSGGVGGSMTNTAEAAKFYEQNYRNFFDDLYYGFLSSEELNLISNGREIYLDAEALQERLERRKKLLMCDVLEEDSKNACGECEDCILAAEVEAEVQDKIVKAAVKKAPAKKQASPTKKAAKA